MSNQPIPNGLLPTNQPDLFFEDNAVGRMKKKRVGRQRRRD